MTHTKDRVIAQLDTARAALARAQTIQATKKIVDLANAAAIYAKRQALGEEAIGYAHQIKIEALSQLGEMLKGMEKRGPQHYSGGGSKGSKREPLLKPPSTLAELGLDKKTSMVAQQLAKMPQLLREQIANREKTMKEAIGPHVSHNSGENEWYTPEVFIELARALMGSIDLDPASSDAANKTVKAKAYYTVQRNGLEKSWTYVGEQANIWLNPPYAQPHLTNFVKKFLHELKARNIREACILVNNATETQWCQQLMGGCVAILFPRNRVRFIGKDGLQGAPLQGQMLLYYGGQDVLFNRLASRLGTVVSPWIPPIGQTDDGV